MNWEVYDHNYNKILEIKAKNLSISGGLIWYKKNNKYAIMDLNKNILIKGKYTSIKHYPHGFTAVARNGCYSMVYKGKEILPFEYNLNFLVDSNESFIAQHGCEKNNSSNTDQFFQRYDKLGKPLFFENKRINMDENYKPLNYGFYIKLTYDKIHFYVKHLYNNQDSIIFTCKDCSISNSFKGMFLVSQTFYKDSNPTYEQYILDAHGATILRNNYRNLNYDLWNDRFFYRRGNEIGLVSLTGIEVNILQINNLSSFELLDENRLKVEQRDSFYNYKSAIYDTTGLILLPFSSSWSFVNQNIFINWSGNKAQLIDIHNKPISRTYDEMTTIINTFDYDLMVKGRIKFFDNCLVSPSHFAGDGRDIATYSNKPDCTVLKTMDKGKVGLIFVDSLLEVVPIYTIVAKTSNNLYALKRDGQWSVINMNGLLKSFRKSSNINFYENYILVGNQYK